MADAQKKNCPHKIPIKGSYCAPTICLDMCKKQHGTQEFIIKQESVRKSNRSCKGSLGLNWLDIGKIESTVSEHDNALVRKNNLTTRVLGRFLQCHYQVRVMRLHPHLSPSSLLRKFP
ncbi:hypothetical protein YC2023_078919 [Brassica napus]